MPKDYAKRKPAPKKKSARSAAKPKGRNNQARNNEPRVRFPWFRTLIAVSLIAAFGYGLSQIRGNAEQAKTAEAIEPSPKDEPVVAEKVVELPDKPHEQWDFIEDLENKQVEVDVPDAPEQTRPYLMQCGSFRLESQANELEAKIAFQGLSSEVRRSEGSNGIWYKVVLGPYQTKRLAEKDRHTLQRASIRGCQIWYW